MFVVKTETRFPRPVRNVVFEARPFRRVRVYSSAVRAADCRSAGPWFDSGCALFLGMTECRCLVDELAVFVKRPSRGTEMEMRNMEQDVKLLLWFLRGRRWHTGSWSHSSVGQSVRLITVRSAVQARVGPPFLLQRNRLAYGRAHPC